MNIILETDIPQIKTLLGNVFHIFEYTSIERLGGLTNHTYKVRLPNGQIYVVRLPGQGTETIINRSDEQVSTRLACNLGIDAELLFFGPHGEKVTRYIDGAKTLSATSFGDKNILRKAAETLRTLHSCGVNTNIPFDVFAIASDYEKIIRANAVALFDGYAEMKTQIMKIRTQTSSCMPAIVPCHNDPLCENWVLDKNEKLFLIDWEYAGMNDGMWDLADLSIEANLSAEQDHDLLQFYFSRDAVAEEIFRFNANKLYLDFLWALWGKARVPFEGAAMEKYGCERYSRLKKNLHVFLEQFPLD